MVNAESKPHAIKMVEVEMFGNFCISADGNTVDSNSARTHQLWNLLEYLITYRKASISTQALINVLWPEGDSEKPENALKNLVYRIRNTMLSELGPEGKNLIVSKNGSYSWNNDIPCTVDIETFEALFRTASNPATPESKKMQAYRKAISLYRGDFLATSHYEQWMVPLRTYYHSIYFKCVFGLTHLLQKEKNFAEIESICTDALAIDQLDERAHIELLIALVRQGKQARALSHYRYATDLFFRELGVGPSEQMRNIYREISKASNNTEMDLQVIKEDLRESTQQRGAYYCEYEVFKNLYRIEARNAVRTGQSIFIGLLTLTSQDEEQVPGTKLLNRSMSELLDTVTQSLRKGDIISRFSSTQYVLMLSCLTFENGLMVMERICKRYKTSPTAKVVKLHTKLLPLDPVM